jgi:hypothetical protein
LDIHSGNCRRPNSSEIAQVLERDDGAFFELVLNHTMQSFYGSPRHGGNRDAVSWRMLGVPDPPVRGRSRDFFKGTAPLVSATTNGGALKKVKGTGGRPA